MTSFKISKKFNGRGLLASLLSLSLLLAAQGPATQAFAGVVTGPVGTPAVNPGGAAGAALTTGAGLELTTPAALPDAALTGGLLPAAGMELNAPALPSAPAALAPAAAAGLIPAQETFDLAHQLAPQAALPAQEAPAALHGALRAAEDPSAPSEPGVGSQGALRSAAGDISREPANASGRLNILYTGASPALTTLSASEQSPLSIHQMPSDAAGLESYARWFEASMDLRLLAVRRLAEIGGEEGRAALGRLADWTGEDTVNGYKVRRQALASLAETFGELRSLPAVSPAQKAELLADLSARPPALTASDYDDTEAEFKKPLAPETAASLHAARKRTQIAIITDRPDRDEKAPENGILSTLEQSPAELRAGLDVVSNKGLKLSRFDETGAAQTVATLDVKWTDAERDAIKAGVAAVEGNFETQLYGTPAVTSRVDAASAVIFLKIGTPADRVAAAAKMMQAAMAERGITLYEVVGRTPVRPTDPPYVTVSKINKSTGMQHLRSLWSDPEGRDVAILGDQFMTQGAGRPTDAFMRDAAPKARVFAVGPTADPREGDIYLWDVKNAAGAREILDAIATPPPAPAPAAPAPVEKAPAAAPASPGFNFPLAMAGLFTQRTISIIAFLMVAIAYPFIATSMVGWEGYGVLMAMGNMTAIATGPLNGMLVDKFSTRNAMLINTAIRVVLLMALPTFYVLGVLNFGTLLLGAMAEGYLLSSIVTTENAFVRRIVPGPKIQTTVDFLMMNFFGLQVLFGLILGIGHIADVVSPVVVYALAAAANAFLVVPLIWLTIPNIAPNAKTVFQLRARFDAALRALAANNRRAARLAPDQGEEFSRLESQRTALVAQVGKLAEEIASRRKQVEEKELPEAQAALDSARAEVSRLSEAEKGRWISSGALRSARAKAAEQAAAVVFLKRQLENRPFSLLENLGSFGRWVGRFLAKYWPEAAIFAAAVASFPFLGSPLPMAAALVYWIMRTDRFRDLWSGALTEPAPAGTPDKPSRLRTAMLYLSLGALIFYPIQYFTLAKVAEVLSGEGKGLLHGQLLGSLFLGNLIALASRVNLPDVPLPFGKKISGTRLFQAGVLGLGFTWMITTAAPGSLVAAAVVTLGLAGLMALATRFTDRGWVQLVGLGFASIWLPFFVWLFPAAIPFLSIPLAMSISMVLVGMFYGPGISTLFGYFARNTRKDKTGVAQGIQGSFFNAAISIGYALLTIVSGFLNPAFPATLAALGLAFAVAGALFWLAPRFLPGLSPTILKPQPKAEVEKAKTAAATATVSPETALAFSPSLGRLPEFLPRPESLMARAVKEASEAAREKLGIDPSTLRFSQAATSLPVDDHLWTITFLAQDAGGAWREIDVMFSRGLESRVLAYRDIPAPKGALAPGSSLPAQPQLTTAQALEKAQALIPDFGVRVSIALEPSSSGLVYRLYSESGGKVEVDAGTGAAKKI